MLEEKKEEEKIVLQVDMHCEGCKDKVRRALKRFPGLEKIEVDMKERKVTVKGKLDAKEVYETVKKTGRRTVLLYPDLEKLDESKEKEQPKTEDPSQPPGPEMVVILKVNMHCGACAKQIKKNLEKMCGVSQVFADVASSQVVVKGKDIDSQKVCCRVRKLGKPCEIVPSPPSPVEDANKDESAKEEPKKGEEKPAEEEAKPAEEKKEEQRSPEEKKEEEKSAAEEKKEGEGEKKEERSEEKKDEKTEEALAAVEGDTKMEIKKYQYIPSSYSRTVYEHVYPPQLFSDENPNACSIM